MDEFIAVNYRNYKRYHDELANVPSVHLLDYDETEKCNYQYIILKIDRAVTQISRDLLVDILHAENVLARRYFFPGSHRMEPYHSYFPHAGLLLPETEKLTEQVLALPTGTAVDERDIGLICEIVKFVVAKGSEISDRLSRSRTHPG